MTWQFRLNSTLMSVGVVEFGQRQGQRTAGGRSRAGHLLQVDICSICAFFSIFQILPDYLAEIFEIWQNFANFATLN